MKDINFIKLSKTTPFMTIIVGILCKDGVVIASDSQAMSQRGVDVKRMDYTKIYDFNGNLNLKIAISGAGAVPFISKSIEILKQKCYEKRIKTFRELVDLAEDTMNDLTKRYCVDKFKNIGISKNMGITRTQDAPFPTLNVILIIGGIDEENRTALYIITPEGIAEKEENFASLGSGSAYAEYVLTRLYYEGIKVNEAIELAVYTIEEVKKIDPNVGGDVQLTVITSNGVEKKNRNEIDLVIQKVTKRDQNLSSIWKNMILGKISDIDIDKIIKK